MNSDSKNESIQGKWFRINKNIKKRITASYDKIKDWKLDPKGYFLIDLDKKKKLLRVGYCIITKSKVSSAHEMVAEICGKTAIEVLNTLISTFLYLILLKLLFDFIIRKKIIKTFA